MVVRGGGEGRAVAGVEVGGGRARIDTEPNRRSAILATPIPGPQKYVK